MELMLKCKLILQYSLGVKKVEWVAPVLKLDGVEFDLSLITDGETIEHTPETGKILKAYRAGDDYDIQVMVVGEQWTTIPDDPAIERTQNGLVYELVVPEPKEVLQ
jgi:hypothetical protein